MVLTLNRPKRKNAMTLTMFALLADAWAELSDDDDLRCAILTGTGDTFCAGMDLSEIGKLQRGVADNEWMERVMREMHVIYGAWLKTYRPTKPVILAAEGFARAGGTEILQGTDIRVAAEDATFGVTEARRGLFPLGGSSVRLRRQIPYTLAAEILLTGRHVSAREALDFGLVGRLVPRGQALAEAMKIAADVAANAPQSIRALMRMLREIDESHSEADALAKELEYGSPVFGTRDAREGMKAFAEKRKPVYTGE
jgi:enoyl-CoA hydratase